MAFQIAEGFLPVNLATAANDADWVNLIAFHAIPGTPLTPALPEKMQQFAALLRGRGLLTTIRQSRGQDIDAACGLLSTRELVRARADADL